MLKVLVTGGGGFLGRYIVEKFSARGDEVTVFSRQEYPFLNELGVRSIEGDITDSAKVNEACAGQDGVIHVASRVGVWGPKEEFHKVNVIGTRNVIEACRKNRVSRLVYTSTPSVVFDGSPHSGIDETREYPDQFWSAYPATKAKAEKEILDANGTGLYTCAIRPHLVWGPRDTNLIPRLADRAERGLLKIVGDGTNRADIVYVENAADAHLLALDKLTEGSPVCGSAYFISQGEPVNLWGFVNQLLMSLGKPVVTKKISFKKAYAAGAILEAFYKIIDKQDEPMMTRFIAMQLAYDHWFNIDKARKELGYEPSVSTEEGLKKTANWWKIR